MRRRSCCLAWLLVLLAAPVAADIPAFFDDLFTEFRSDYEPLREQEFVALCSDHGLIAADPENRRTFFRIRFLHDLLTGRGASDGARGGILRIPYCWHWIEPNPRHAILLLPEGRPLAELPPPAGFRRYATRGDVDRVPEIFLGDLVAEEVMYRHPTWGDFCSFGWCSEREMAFTSLVESWGLSGKIWQEGIHTHSMVWCDFARVDGELIALAANVDNTFDALSWTPIPGASDLESWLQQVGSGGQIGWYNGQARSRQTLSTLRTIAVGRAAAMRIRRQMRTAIVGAD